MAAAMRCANRRAAVGDHSAPIEKPITVSRFSWWTGIRAAATITVEDVKRQGSGSGPKGIVDEQENRPEIGVLEVTTGCCSGPVANVRDRRARFCCSKPLR
jgi:hypothetical protein